MGYEAAMCWIRIAVEECVVLYWRQCAMRIQESTYILIESAQFTRLRKIVITNITCKEIKFGKVIFGFLTKLFHL